MTQGRQFRWTVLALGCVLAAALAILPASAGAQGAIDEYELGDLPSADGDNGAQASGADEATGDTPSPGSADAPVGDGDASGDSEDDSAAVGGGSKGSGKGGAKPVKGGSDPTESVPGVPAVTAADTSDGGGAPIALIALAALTAIAAGLAVWRLRRGGGDHTVTPGEPAGSTGGGPSA